ncbi:small rab-related gtpase [Anaeramoeba flamelloides]|uniref:Small rab-related gtpase n=1 Tax=Anaeramoeba flamelloides TaxID=1746091 RepID=A0ABQ8ZC84_9EUKA|nr:small rab-related gtpase [Anaeramoeba flamelloides]
MGNSETNRTQKSKVIQLHNTQTISIQSTNENIKSENVTVENHTEFTKKCWNEFVTSRFTSEPFISKIVLVGHQQTGKSCILLKFADNVFSQSYISTIGVDFKIKQNKYWEKDFKMQIWDTAGQERFSTITSSYYRGAHSIILIFDITNKESFEKVKTKLSDLKNQISEDTPVLLVGNKIDLENKREISTEEALEYADKNGLPYMEVSAKEGTNIDLMFKISIGLQFDNWRKKTHPNKKWMDLTPSLLDIFALNSFNEDFANFYKNQDFSDFEIKGLKCHRLIVEARLGKSMKDIEIILNKYTKEEVNFFFEWVYGDKVSHSNKDLINEICTKLGIQNYEEKDFVQDIKALYKSNETKDFSLFVKDEDYEEEEEEEEEEEGEQGEEIPIHKMILLVRSGLFRNMFKNVQENLSTVTDYSGRSIDTVECLLKFLYTDEIEMTADYDREIVMEELKDAAEFYQFNERSTLIKFLEEN